VKQTGDDARLDIEIEAHFFSVDKEVCSYDFAISEHVFT
jgi:hypothetical protein